MTETKDLRIKEACKKRATLYEPAVMKNIYPTKEDKKKIGKTQEAILGHQGLVDLEKSRDV